MSGKTYKLVPRRGSTKKTVLFWAAVLCLGTAAFLTSVYYLVDPNNYRDYISRQLSQALDQPVAIKRLSFDISEGFGLALQNVQIGSQPLDTLKLKEIFVTFQLLPLFHRELLIDEITLTAPDLYVQRDVQGNFHFPFKQLLLKKAAQAPALKQVTIDQITISHGRLVFTDEFREIPYSVTARNFNLNIENFKPDQPLDFEIQAELYSPERGGNIGAFDMDGEVVGLTRTGDLQLSEQELIDNLLITAEGRLEQCNLTAIQTYLADYTPWTGLDGLAEGELVFRGSLSRGFQLDLQVRVASAQLDYPEIFTNPLPFSNVRTTLKLTFSPHDQLAMECDDIDLDCGSFHLKGNVKLNDLLGGNLHLLVQVNVTPLTVSDVHRYIAYSVIPPKVTEFMRQSFISGHISGLQVKLDGSVNDFAALSEPENGNVIQASAQFERMRVKLPELPYYLDQAKVRVKLGQGGIIFEDLSGNIEDTQLSAKKVTLNHIYTGEPSWDLTSDIALNWEDKIVTGIFPEKLLDSLHPRGQSNFQLKSAGDKEQFTVSGRIIMEQTGYDYQDWFLKKIGYKNRAEFDLSIDNLQEIEIKELHYLFRDSSLQLSGRVGTDKSIALDLSTSDFQLEDLAQLFPKLLAADSQGILAADLSIEHRAASSKSSMKIAEQTKSDSEPAKETQVTGSLMFKDAQFSLVFEPLSMGGEGFGDFTLLFRPEIFSLQGDFNLMEATYIYSGWLEKKQTGFDNQLALNLSFPENKGLKIKDLVFKFGPGEVHLSGYINDFETLEANLKAKGKHLDLSLWRQLLNPVAADKAGQVAGNLEFDLKLRGQLNTPKLLNIEGRAEAHKARLSDSDPPYDLQGIEAKFYSQSDNGINFDFQAGQGFYKEYTFSNLKAKGAWREPALDIASIRMAEFRHKETLFLMKDVAAKVNYKPDTGASFNLEAPAGSCKKFDFTDFVGHGHWDKSTLDLDDFSALVYDGKLNFDGQVKLFDNANPGYEFNFDASGINAGKFIRRITEGKRIISGDMSFEGELFNPGKTPGALDKLAGRFNLKMVNGGIKKHETLAKIFAITNPSSLFKEVPKLEGGGFPYYSITGDFDIKDGVVRTQNLILDSSAWKILALGQVDLVHEQIDNKIYVQPWRTADQIISKIPVINRILQGERGGFLDTYYTVKGDLLSPEVEAHHISSLSENVWGIITRTLSMPIDLIKSIYNTSPSPQPATEE